MGLGVFHSGIEVYGQGEYNINHILCLKFLFVIFITEYGYGGHDRSDSGIFDMIPKDVYELGDHYRYR